MGNFPTRPLGEKTMKSKERLAVSCASFALMVVASQALAASGGKGEENGILIILFFAFGALIIVFQFAPGVLLFVSMIKGLFGNEKEAVAAKESGDNS